MLSHYPTPWHYSGMTTLVVLLLLVPTFLEFLAVVEFHKSNIFSTTNYNYNFMKFRKVGLNLLKFHCRLFSLGEQNIVATSSCDHSIRLWWKVSLSLCKTVIGSSIYIHLIESCMNIESRKYYNVHILMFDKEGYDVICRNVDIPFF